MNSGVEESTGLDGWVGAGRSARALNLGLALAVIGPVGWYLGTAFPVNAWSCGWPGLRWRAGS